MDGENEDEKTPDAGGELSAQPRVTELVVRPADRHKGPRPPRGGPNSLRTPNDVARFAARCARLVKFGSLSPAAGNAISGLLRTVLVSLEAADGDSRINALEERIAALCSDQRFNRVKL